MIKLERMGECGEKFLALKKWLHHFKSTQILMVEQFSNIVSLFCLVFFQSSNQPFHVIFRPAGLLGGSSGGLDWKWCSSLLAVGREERMDVTIDGELVDTLCPIRGLFIVDIEHLTDVESDGGINGCSVVHHAGDEPDAGVVAFVDDLLEHTARTDAPGDRELVSRLAPPNQLRREVYLRNQARLYQLYHRRERHRR